MTAPLWFTKGIKQGYRLSPLLFSLYMAGLGEELHAMKECVNFNGQVISALFFADDLVLILRTKVTGMEHMLKEVSRFSKGVYMKLSIVLSIFLYCSFLFRFVLFHYVLSRTTVFPFRSILGVII